MAGGALGAQGIRRFPSGGMALDNHFDQYANMLEHLLQDMRSDMVRDLSELLMFYTVSGADDPEEKRHCANEFSRAFSFLSRLAGRMGFVWRNYDNRVAVIEAGGEGGEVIGLPLHVDVVPSGEGWHYPAFGGMVEDGVIYGRGAQDDKGPIIQMLYALHAVKRLHVPLKRTVRLIVASQEETGDWSDVRDYLEREPAPHFSIVADGDFPVGNGEKGMVDLRVRLLWNEELKQNSVLEFDHIEGGERSNIVPNRSDIVWDVSAGQSSGVTATLRDCLQDYLNAHRSEGADAFPLRLSRHPQTGQQQAHITFLGKGAHSSTPEEGHNAILDALRFFPSVPQMPEPLRLATRFLAEACGDHYGSGLGIDAKHYFIGPTTINLGVLRIDTEGLEVTINVRSTFGQKSADVLSIVRKRVEEWAGANDMEALVEFRGECYEPLYVDPAKHPEMIGALREAFSRVTGHEAELIAKGGTTFAKAFPNAVSFGPVYPAEDKPLFHQADECLRIDQLLRNTKIYGLALLLLAADLTGRRAEVRQPGMGLGL